MRDDRKEYKGSLWPLEGSERAREAGKVSVKVPRPAHREKEAVCSPDVEASRVDLEGQASGDKLDELQPVCKTPRGVAQLEMRDCGSRKEQAGQ